jgi:CheY-like chemotaxis protein
MQNNTNKILVVEDEPVLLEVVSDMLKEEQFTVIQAHDGEEGLAMALKEKPDLIILDILMPKMDGLTMLKHLRKDEWGKNARVIITTSVNEETTIQEAMNHGVYDYLIKAEWSLEDLVRKVKDKLGNF